jgi:hypothetical protein
VTTVRIPLTYAVLDDMILALTVGRHESVKTAFSRCTASTIGPIVEYALHRRSNPELPSLSGLPGSRVTRALAEMTAGQSNSSLSLDPLECEFRFLAPVATEFDQPSWIAFCKRLERAAGAGGFKRPAATGIAGAFVEMADNVIQHSESSTSAIVGYQWTPSEFEYVVADSGIGVLQSLRKNNDYRHLTDDADALLTALSPGESRFGRGSAHGNGFRTVFLSLAQYRGSLRFRSGDQALEIDGTGPNLLNHRMRQRAVYTGFMTSVACRP